MHPSPAEVRSWFIGELTGAALARHVTMLQADTDWRVEIIRSTVSWTLLLWYLPTTELVVVKMARLGERWHVLDA